MQDYSKLVHFLFEVGMLRKTPRSGYQFLGTGQENVAEHSFRTAIIGFVLGKLAQVDAYKLAIMCLIHDFPEARCGDFNYVNKIYNQADHVQAFKDSVAQTGLEELLNLFIEFEEVNSKESLLAQDADQLDLMLNLKEQLDLGNKYAKTWLECAQKRLRTKEGKLLAKHILNTDSQEWWFTIKDKSWWEQKSNEPK